MYLIIPTTLVCILFCTAIPTSPINFIQLFFMLVSVPFLLPLGNHMHCLWATPTLGSILACLCSFMLSFSKMDHAVKADQVHTSACVCIIML